MAGYWLTNYVQTDTQRGHQMTRSSKQVAAGQALGCQE
jgi:hypothetical protein